MSSNYYLTELPKQALSTAEAYQVIADQLRNDGDPSMNLGTFSTCLMDAEADRLIGEVIGKNFIDQHAYPNLEAIHQQIISVLGHLFHAPGKCHPVGTATSGSSEAIMLGLLAHKVAWRNNRRAAKQDSEKPNIVMGDNVHVCWKKFAVYFDVESRVLPVRNERCVIAAEQVAEAIDENTIAVSCVAGNTYTGHIDDVEAVNAVLSQAKCERGWDIPIHVDAAIGGFVLPFLHPDLIWDFRLEQVRSINVSNHKFGLVYPGMGTLLFRDRSVLPEELIFNTSYTGTAFGNFSLTFSRPSSTILLQYYNLLRLGETGYRNALSDALTKAQYLADHLTHKNRFYLISDPNILPVVVARLSPEFAKQASVYTVAKHLRKNRWIVPAYPLPIEGGNNHVLRLTAKPSWTYPMIDVLLQDVEQSFEKNYYGTQRNACR